MRDFDDGSQAELLDTGVHAYVCVCVLVCVVVKQTNLNSIVKKYSFKVKNELAQI